LSPRSSGPSAAAVRPRRAAADPLVVLVMNPPTGGQPAHVSRRSTSSPRGVSARPVPSFCVPTSAAANRSGAGRRQRPSPRRGEPAVTQRPLGRAGPGHGALPEVPSAGSPSPARGGAAQSACSLPRPAGLAGARAIRTRGDDMPAKRRSRWYGPGHRARGDDQRGPPALAWSQRAPARGAITPPG
jgi:hypothetical protein